MLSMVKKRLCHTLRGCVDWNVIGNGSLISILCHTLRGCVDWNNDEVNTCIDNQSHPTWVCGLKQRDWQEKMWGMVTPYVGVWIETLELAFNADGFQGHTLRGCVDWNLQYHVMYPRYRMSHPTWVCGLKHQWPSIRQYRRWSHPAWEYMDWSIVHSSVKFMEEL